MLNTPFADYQTVYNTDPDNFIVPVGAGGWTTNLGTDPDIPGSLLLDENHSDGGFGFGPMAHYLSHSCYEETKFSISNLSMSMGSVRKLHEVVADPHWHDNTKRVLVNLNMQEIEDFSTAAQMGDLLARVIKDDIFYIGWCSNENKNESQQFSDASNPTGKLINVEAVKAPGKTPGDTESRKLQILEMAKAIYDVWYKSNVDNRVLVTDDVSFTVSDGMGQNTAEPGGAWEKGKWMFVHKTPQDLGWEVNTSDPANTTRHEESSTAVGSNEKRMSNLDIDFTYPGDYDIYYRNVRVKTITAHRKPVTQITTTIDLLGNVTIDDLSSDPDDLNAVKDPERGIVKKTWKWTLFVDGQNPVTWGPNESMTPPTIPQLQQGDVYLIELTVEDKWGATTTTAKTVKGDAPGDKQPPMAVFNLDPVTLIYGLSGQEFTIVNNSYDDYGASTLNYAWACKVSKVAPADAATASTQANAVAQAIGIKPKGEGSYSTTALPVGEYKVELIVTTDDQSQPPSLLASRTFWVIKDTKGPIAIVDKPAKTDPPTPPIGTYDGYTTVTLTFQDPPEYDNNSNQNVLSGIKEQYVIVSPTRIANPSTTISNWGTASAVNNRAVDLPVGDSYIYWKATDNVGNTEYGEFAYTVNKLATPVTLTPDPASISFGDGKVLLTAELAPSPSPNPYESGMIAFYMNNRKIGEADIIRGTTTDQGKTFYTAFAVFEVSPEQVTPMDFRAEFIGDGIHDAGTGTLTYTVNRSTDVAINSIYAESKVYDGSGINTPDVDVHYGLNRGTTTNHPAANAGDPNQYVISYSGNEYGTVPYPSQATSPVNVGEYKATATTTNPNYNVVTDYADFVITPRPVTVTIIDPGPLAPGDRGTFTAIIGNVIDLPTGSTVSFFLDGDVMPVGGPTVVSTHHPADNTVSETWTWLNVESGDHSIMAVFDTPANSNYEGNSQTITYNVSKASQAIQFVHDATNTPITDEDGSDLYTDPTLFSGNVYGTTTDIFIKAAPVGPAGSGTITYELISQSPAACVEFNPTTRRLKIKGAGECLIQATKAEDAQYNAAPPVQLLVKIAKAPGNVTAQVGSVDYLVPIDPQITANLSGGALTYSYTGSDNSSNAYASPMPPTQAGTYWLTVTSAATANYDAATSLPAGFTINRIPQNPAIQLNYGQDTTVLNTQAPFPLPVTGGSGTGAVTWGFSSIHPPIGTPPQIAVDRQNGLITIDTTRLTALEYTVTITVTKAQDNNYLVSAASQDVIVMSKAAELTAEASGVLPPDFVKDKEKKVTGEYEWTVAATGGNPPLKWTVENLPKGMRWAPTPDLKSISIFGASQEVFFDSVRVTVGSTQTSGGVTPIPLEVKVPVTVFPAPTASTDDKPQVDVNEEMVVTYPIPMNEEVTGDVYVNGRLTHAYWLSDEEFIIPPPLDGYEYETNYTVRVIWLKDKKNAIKNYTQEFTFRTGQRPRPPVIAREVIILPLPEGVTSEPVAEEEHLILSGEDFIFTLFVPDGMEPSAATNRVIAGAPERLKGQRIDETNAYHFVVRQIRQEGVQVSVLLEPRSEVGNSGVLDAEPRIWSHGGKLYVETTQQGVLSVYTMTGELCLQETVAPGSARFTLPQGVYVARIHGKVYKALIH